MGSRKRSAQVKQIAQFKAGLDAGGFDDLFAREEERHERREEEHEAVLRYKACESKNRYATQAEAYDAMRSCAEYGTKGLHAYKCPHCNGWHLTSKPQRKG